MFYSRQTKKVIENDCEESERERDRGKELEREENMLSNVKRTIRKSSMSFIRRFGTIYGIK